MKTDDALNAFIERAERVIAAVRNDNIGVLVGGQYVGGNGGLLSCETMVEVDALAREIDQWKRWHVPVAQQHPVKGEVIGLDD